MIILHIPRLSSTKQQTLTRTDANKLLLACNIKKVLDTIFNSKANIQGSTELHYF